MRDFNVKRKVSGEVALKFKDAPDTCKRCVSWQGIYTHFDVAGAYDIRPPPSANEQADIVGGGVGGLDAAAHTDAGADPDEEDVDDISAASGASERRGDDSQAATRKGE